MLEMRGLLKQSKIKSVRHLQLTNPHLDPKNYTEEMKDALVKEFLKEQK
jgi:hypothetical protein